MLQHEIDISEVKYRLKTRLALANFKRQYGYEKYDLYTLESFIRPKKTTSKPEEDAARVLIMLHKLK